MPPKARAYNDNWSCPKCNMPNNVTGLVERTPDTVEVICDTCGIRVEVFIPLQQDGPYRADGIMQDQLGAEMTDTLWWDFTCPLCHTHNKTVPPPYKLGQPKRFDRIVPCRGCHKNIRIEGES